MTTIEAQGSLFTLRQAMTRIKASELLAGDTLVDDFGSDFKTMKVFKIGSNVAADLRRHGRIWPMSFRPEEEVTIWTRP